MDELLGIKGKDCSVQNERRT